MKTFKEYFVEKQNNFLGTLESLKEQGFVVKEGKIGGDRGFNIMFF
jgi:hypothetical protein